MAGLTRGVILFFRCKFISCFLISLKNPLISVVAAMPWVPKKIVIDALQTGNAHVSELCFENE